MPRDFIYEREADFLRDAEGVTGSKYVTIEGETVRAFFRSAWWICAYEVTGDSTEKAKQLKAKFVAAGFTPISIKESPIKIF